MALLKSFTTTNLSILPPPLGTVRSVREKTTEKMPEPLHFIRVTVTQSTAPSLFIYTLTTSRVTTIMSTMKKAWAPTTWRKVALAKYLTAWKTKQSDAVKVVLPRSYFRCLTRTPGVAAPAFILTFIRYTTLTKESNMTGPLSNPKYLLKLEVPFLPPLLLTGAFVRKKAVVTLTITQTGKRIS